MAETSTDDIEPGAVKGVHETVIELIKNEKPGRILDAGAGRGALSFKLNQMKFEVTSGDIFPDQFQVKGMTCQKLDLNDELPYPIDYFDYIACVEAIEHIENPWNLIEGFSRVLKPDGKLILSTPNIINLQSRLYFFLTGELIYFRERDYTGSGHITPIPLWNLKRMLEKENFVIESIEFNRSKIPLTNIEIPIKNIFLGEILILKAVKKTKIGGTD